MLVIYICIYFSVSYCNGKTGSIIRSQKTQLVEYQLKIQVTRVRIQVYSLSLFLPSSILVTFESKQTPGTDRLTQGKKLDADRLRMPYDHFEG